MEEKTDKKAKKSRGVGQVIERGGELTNSPLNKSGIFGLSNFGKWK